MKTKTRKIKKMTITCLIKVLLLGLFLTGLNTAFAVDFITKAQFEAEKSTYKDYPFKILFKKLAEGDAAEQRIIRNTIILKQAFDRHMQEKIKGGIVNYKETFGIIKDIGRDHLKLWVPKTDSIADFYLGIDRIPIINDQNYQVTESDIGKYAAVIYSLDDRIYQIKISFQPASPTGLAVKREDGKNIVSWNRPTADQKPVGYKLFINEKPFERVDEPVIKVPRIIGQADEYYVKAIYKHGDSFVESDASDIQIDEITAKEVQREILAWETYDRIVAALTPPQWQAAEKLLHDSQPFLSEHLDGERKQNIAQLSAFFAEIDGGDRLGTAASASVQNLESALMFYQRAEQKARTLPAGIDVLFIPHLKIGESQQRLARLQTQQKEFSAGATYDRIIAALNPSHWRSAEKLLYDNQQFLSESLDEKRKLIITGLIAFFTEIDEGDRFSTVTPDSVQNLKSALMFYQRAETKAKALPSDIDVVFIPRLKVDESQQRMAQLEIRQKELAAGETYNRIINALNPSRWQDAEKLLYDNQQFLSEHLDQERKQNTAGLIAFFAEVDEGNRLSRATPESVQTLESALMFYQRAETKAKALPAAIDVMFIPRLKFDESQHRLDKLKAAEKELVAARSAKTEAITPSKAPEPSEKILDSDTETKVAMKDFKTRDYTSALHHFENIYSSQIANLKQSGDKHIRGLLALPIKHRAEVIFLIELDRLKKENNNDEELIKQGLEMIYEKIDSGEGPWSIIPESKRKTIKRHIEKYGT